MKKTLFFLIIVLTITFFYKYFTKNIPDNIPEREIETPEIQNNKKYKKLKTNKNKILNIDNQKIKRGRDLSRNSITNREKTRVVNSKFYKQKKAISNMINRIEREKLHEK